MSLESWRHFQFYDNLPIPDPLLGNDIRLYSDPTLSAAATVNEDLFFIAVRSNYIRHFSLKKAEIIKEFKAFADGFQISYLMVVGQSFLLAVGEKVNYPSQLKLFKINDLPTNEFHYHSLVEIKNSDNTFPISSVSVSNELNCIVVGFVNGKILLIKGDLSRDRGSQQRILYEDSTGDPITSLFLNSDASSCFATTTSRIMMFNLMRKSKSIPEQVLSSKEGVALKCASFSKFTNEYICCMNDYIQFYHENGERHDIPIKISNPKKLMPINKTELLIIFEEERQKTTSIEYESGASNNICKAIVIDLENSILSFSFYTTSNIVDVLPVRSKDDSILYLVTAEGLMYKVSKKSLDERLSIVMNKEMFPFALQLASDCNLPDNKIQKINKLYGDYLYSKGLHTEAAQQYMKCIDILDISDIITKLGANDVFDVKAMRNLADFVWELIRKGRADHDTVTLLLSVLIKLKDEDGLKRFVSYFRRSGKYIEKENYKDLDDESYFFSDLRLFDLELIRSLLIDSKLNQLCYQFVFKFSKDPIMITDVLLNVLKETEATLKYVKSLSVDDILRVLVRFSKQLLYLSPNETNLLLIEVFTGKYRPSSYVSDINNVVNTKTGSKSEKNPVFYSYTAFLKYMNPLADASVSDASENGDRLDVDRPTYHPPKPSLVFNAFLSRPFEFVVFLEACLESYKQFDGFKNDRQEILTTLYDLYLTLSKQDVGERKSEWTEKANLVLNESNELANELDQNSNNNLNKVDNSLMKLIAHMNGLNVADISSPINENKEFSNDVTDNARIINGFRNLTYMGEVSECMKFFEEHSKNNIDLFPMALSYFISKKEILEFIGGEDQLVKKIIKPIIENNIMSILDLLQILSSRDFITYGCVKDILLDRMKEEDAVAKRTKKLIASYSEELQDKKTQLRTYLSPDHEQHIAIKDKKCDLCHITLELPVIYFKCEHIYHQKCLNEEADLKNEGDLLYKCPKCVIDIETSSKRISKERELASRKELLDLAFKEEGNNSDRFRIVSDFIGRGALENSYITIES